MNAEIDIDSIGFIFCSLGAKPNFLPRCSETRPRVRFSVGENRMKLANATNLNRKFGKPRDLQFSFPTYDPSWKLFSS
jgi:hypothetical protein